jgi:putative CRISPR-associated protein (TIGR02620 family)
MNTHVVVTRHAALVTYLIETGVIQSGTGVITHATPDQIAGRDVIGVLPMHLAAVCNTVTEVPLALTESDRGQELTVERLRQVAGPPRTYKVRLV